MSNSFGKPLMYLRDRWRWVRGRCPLCNRNLYAAFPLPLAQTRHGGNVDERSHAEIATS
jgi:hypothetical protein